MTRKNIIENVAQQWVDGFNKRYKTKATTVDTLFNFGPIGLFTIRELTAVFYDSIIKQQKHTHPISVANKK